MVSWSRKRPGANFAALSDVAGRPVGSSSCRKVFQAATGTGSQRDQVWLRWPPGQCSPRSQRFRPINSLWFWVPAIRRARCNDPRNASVQTAPLARGLVRFAGLVLHRFDTPRTSRPAAAVRDPGTTPAKELPVSESRRLAQLDSSHSSATGFARAFAALKIPGNLDELRITAPCERATLDFTLKGAACGASGSIRSRRRLSQEHRTTRILARTMPAGTTQRLVDAGYLPCWPVFTRHVASALAVISTMGSRPRYRHSNCSGVREAAQIAGGRWKPVRAWSSSRTTTGDGVHGRWAMRA